MSKAPPPSLPACVAHAYGVFARYPRKLAPGNMAWDISDPEIRNVVARVKATRLRDLDPETLEYVWLNATSSATAFKHFLPRVLELVRAGDFVPRREVCERLLGMQLASWPAAERAAVAACLAPWADEASEDERVARVRAICEARD